jgi:hypothetical protein
MIPDTFPRGTRGQEWRFTNVSTVTNVQWQTFQVPTWATMLNIVCIGGGGAGGAGFSGTAGTARGGGGGGGSSAVTRVVVPASFVPSTLFIQVGAGGIGGSGAGGSGLLSYVSVFPAAIDTNFVARSGAVAAGGGGAGTVSAAGAAGSAGTVSVPNHNPYGAGGVSNYIVGQAGVLGGVHTGAVGVNQTLPNSGLFLTGGAGGAGTQSADFAGGGFTAITNSYPSQQRPIAPAAGSNNGSAGINMFKPLWFFGGCGGSASNTGVGGAGGNGGYGCGGGGGGGGTTGGRGGNGGDGIVIITAI